MSLPAAGEGCELMPQQGFSEPDTDGDRRERQSAPAQPLHEVRMSTQKQLILCKELLLTYIAGSFRTHSSANLQSQPDDCCPAGFARVPVEVWGGQQ